MKYLFAALFTLALSVYIFSGKRKISSALESEIKTINFSSFSEKSREPKLSSEPQRKPSAIKNKKIEKEAVTAEVKVKDFLKKKTGQLWKLEMNNSQIVSLYGGTVKELVNTDEKLQSFVSELAATMGYDKINFTEAKDLQKKSALETINEFHQNIGDIEVYGAYFRSFRDSDKLEGSFFINEFKKYDQVSDAESFTLEDVKSKISQYYDRLATNVSETNCTSKVYFINQEQNAQLAYKCVVKVQAVAAGALPEVYEVLVSLSNADVLFQKKISILN